MAQGASAKFPAAGLPYTLYETGGVEVPGGGGTLTDGATFKLKANQFIKIEAVPNCKFTVTEQNLPVGYTIPDGEKVVTVDNLISNLR